MRSLAWTTLLCITTLAMSSSVEAVSIKTGGGIVLDPTSSGGHISFEVPISDDYPTYLAPFLEYYSKDGESLMPIGITLLYKAPFSTAFGTIYFGVGGGILSIRDRVSLDQFNNPTTFSATKALVSAGGGVRISLTERIGFFGQMRWFRPFSSGDPNQVSVPNRFAFHGGLHFELGSED